jgi:hypothetical protein
MGGRRSWLNAERYLPHLKINSAWNSPVSRLRHHGEARGERLVDLTEVADQSLLVVHAELEGHANS